MREQASVFVCSEADGWPIGPGDAGEAHARGGFRSRSKSKGSAPRNDPRLQRLVGILGVNTPIQPGLMREKLVGRPIQATRPPDIRRSEMDDRREPFGMPFANREVAVIVANELNRHGRGIWFHTVERQIEGKRWIIIRDVRKLDLVESRFELRQARDA
jgi:hypothetical protein